MFCPNCGTKNDNNPVFCKECGIKLTQNVMPVENNNVTMTEELSNKSNKAFEKVSEKTKLFLSKYKKQCILTFCSLFIIFMILILYNTLFGFERLGWNKEYKNIDLKYIMQTNIKLGITFEDEENIDKIKYDVSCGNLTSDGLELNWDLSESLGKCKITAKYKLRKISKEFTVIPDNYDPKRLVLDYEIDYDSEEDLDLDGLTNKQEKEYKTNPTLMDTDMDDLDDNYELFTSKTDPNKEDTDGDGLTDNVEIKLDLDPLKEDSKNDGIKDGERELLYNYNSANINIVIRGTGNITDLKAEVNNNTKVSAKEGLIDKLYTLYTGGNLKEATIVIPYTEEELNKYGLTEDNLTIYYYNENELKYEEVQTTVDKINKTLTATLQHFSNYVVGDKNLVKTYFTNQILFVLDNSWSMYSNEQYTELTGETTSTILDGFDEAGLRFTLTSDLVSSLADKSYEIGLSEFRRDYANALEIGSSSDAIKEKLKNMTGKFITDTEGTNITNALNNGIKEFDKESDNKYIVILTDGQDDSLTRNVDKIAEKANENNVKICSVGFGGGSYNDALEKISTETGCEFYSSSNATGLEELFTNIEANLNDNLVDIDGDNEMDGLLIADSGFVVNRDGFSFGNYGSNYSSGGHCYGMATFAQLYYKKLLPLSLESKTVDGQTSHAYDLNGTYFASYSNLYDYRLKTNELKYFWGFDYFNEIQPADLRTIKNDTLYFSEDHKKIIEAAGFYNLSITESELESQEQLERWGFNYSFGESLQLDEDKVQTSSVIRNEDKQLFNAIYAGFIKQDSDINYSSGMDLTLWLRKIFKTEIVQEFGGAGFIEILKNRLTDQDAPVMSSVYDDGLHAVNAISLIQDIENPNYYYIGVYDNNYPGEKRYVDLKCNQKTCATSANEYYSSNNEPIRITLSLEDDLKYFE